MGSGAFRTKSILVALAAAAVLALSTPTLARQTAATAKGISVDDKPYYLDVGDSLPASFHRLTPDEVADLAGGDFGDPTAVAYQSDESEVGIIVNLDIGKGRNSRAVLGEALDEPDQPLATEDVVELLAEENIPADRISVSPAEWVDVEVGDAAKSGIATVTVDGEAVIHFEMLLMLVNQGSDTALAAIAQVFATVPEVDIVEVGRVIAERIHAGPPSPEQVIADAGLVTLADLPQGWEQTSGASTTTSSSGASSPDTNDSGNGEQALALAKRIPACKAFVAVVDADASATGGHANRSKTGVPETFSLDGARFGLGPAEVSSRVSVYPTPAVARQLLDLARTPSIKPCLAKLYRKEVTTGLQSAGTALPENERKLLKQVGVTVATPESAHVGDDRMLFTVTVDLRPWRDVQFVIEAEFVQVGRAVGMYTFSTFEGGSIREGVLQLATERLTASFAAVR